MGKNKKKSAKQNNPFKVSNSKVTKKKDNVASKFTKGCTEHSKLETDKVNAMLENVNETMRMQKQIQAQQATMKIRKPVKEAQAPVDIDDAILELSRL